MDGPCRAGLPAHFGLKGVFLWTEDEKTPNKVMKETQRL